MKFLKSLMSFFVVCGVISSVYADGSSSEINERDMEAVRQLVRSKRAMYLEEKTSNLAISGDVRFEYKHRSQEYTDDNGNEYDARGSGSGSFDETWCSSGCMQYGSNTWDVEFNLYMDYTTSNTWAGVHLEFDNNGGVTSNCGDDNCSDDCGSGTCSEICLREAYMGYNIFEDGESRLDVEVGRRDAFHLFESRVQFQHRFDGGWVTYSNSFENVLDLYVRGGVFVVDSVVDNYGWIFEIGILDLVDIGLDIHYSFVDYTRSRDRCGDTEADNSTCVAAWKYQNSQLALTYHLDPEMVGVDMAVYTGVVFNHAADSVTISGQSHKERWAFYLGMIFGGGIKAEGDWSLDVNYQLVGTQSIPCFGVSGIGLGNTRGECFDPPYFPIDIGQGQTNYHGFAIEGGYAITDNITVQGEMEFSWLLEDWGTTVENDYSKYEVEFIYAF